MKNIFTFFGAFLALVMSLFLIACDGNKSSVAKNEVDAIKAKGKVVIGVFGDKPPFGYVDSNGANQGYDIYVAKQVVKEMFGDKVQVEFKAIEAQNRVEFLKSDKVDIVFANFTKTKEREEVVDFGLPYMKVTLGVVSKNPLKSIDELNGKTLIVNKGTTADFYFSQNKNINILKFDQNTEAFQALKDGRGEALAHDNLLLYAWAKNNPPFAVVLSNIGDSDVIAPAVKKGNKALLEELNKAMAKLGSQNFMAKAYDATLKEVYGQDVNMNDIIIEPQLDNANAQTSQENKADSKNDNATNAQPAQNADTNNQASQSTSADANKNDSANTDIQPAQNPAQNTTENAQPNAQNPVQGASEEKK